MARQTLTLIEGVFVNSVSKVWFLFFFFFHKLMQGNLKEEYGSLSKGFFSGMTTLTAQQTWCYWWRYKVLNQQREWAQAFERDVMGECLLVTCIMPTSNPFDSLAAYLKINMVKLTIFIMRTTILDSKDLWQWWCGYTYV